MFTRQHFIVIAAVISRARKAVSRTGDSHVLAQFDNLFVPMVAKELATTNPAFKEGLFIKACGVQQDVKP